MFRYGLKTSVAINLAVLLMIAMVLIHVVTIIVTQNVLIRSEILRGYRLISIIENRISNKDEPGKLIDDGAFYSQIEQIVQGAGFFGIILVDEETIPIFSYGDLQPFTDNLVQLTADSVRSKKNNKGFYGSTYGIFWEQQEVLCLASPMNYKENTIGGAGILLRLDGVYSILHNIQQFSFVYILINTFFLTLIGLYCFSKTLIRPIYRLLYRAEDFDYDDGAFFLHEDGKNEFNQLSRALNRMLQRISDDNEKLQRTVFSLEQANSRLKVAQKEIIRAEKLASVGRLSAGIAHEIGNPIAIIMGYFDLLKNRSISQQDKDEFINRAEDEVNRINRTIRHLLDFARPSKEHMEIVSAHEIIEDVTEACKIQPLMSDISVALALDSIHDKIFCNPDQLKQVLLNLMINANDAIAASPGRADGHLTVGSEYVPASSKDGVYAGDLLKIKVTDNGVGIPKENLDGIFDPFFTTKDPGKGTGLGLSVSFMIIEAFEGKMEVSSEDGIGTSMIVYLPLSAIENKSDSA
ncbi:ATP-binding protein [Desulfobacterales bacterium HSG16]|nr:ATP-binding protein [Desulfobacterales bacterium HSG16]